MILRISEAAALAIVEQADYYLEVSDSELAARWESAVDETVRSLLHLPERGAPCRFTNTALAGLRWIPVSGFPKHLVIYQFDETKSTLLVVQVIHGAREVELLLREQS